MKNIKNIQILCLFIVLIVPLNLFAGFNRPLGSRAMGMGNAFVGLADDPSAIYYNPGGLDQIRAQTLYALHDDLSLDRNFDSMTLAIPDVWDGTVAFSYQNYGVTGLERLDANGDLLEFFEDSESKYTFTYSNQLTKWIGLGFNLKYFRQRLDVASANGFGMDLGLLFTLHDKLSLGLSFMDMMSNVNWKNTASNGDEDGETVFMAGMAFKPLDNVALLIDVDKKKDLPSRTHYGVEFSFKDTLVVRAGVDNDDFTFGASVFLRKWRVDYAFMDNELGDINRVAATVEFDGPAWDRTTFFREKRDRRKRERTAKRKERRLERIDRKEAIEKAKKAEETIKQFDNATPQVAYTPASNEDLAVIRAESLDDIEAVKKMIEKDEFTQALSKIESVLKKDPYNYEAYRYRGVVHLKNNRHKEALQSFEQALYIKQDEPYMYVTIGDIHETLGDKSKAISYYEQVISRFPNDRMALIAAKMIRHLKKEN